MSSLVSKKSHVTIRWATVLIALTVTAASLLQAANINHVSADDGGYPWTASSGANCVDGTDCSTSYNWGYGLPCPQVDPSCTTYEYPNSQNPTAGMGDPWGYGVRNCTSYVAWKVNQTEGANVSGWKDAYLWASNAPSSEVHAASGYTPQVGDIAQWNSSVSNLDGHVAYVYAVNGTTASLAEYNSGYPKNGSSFQWGLFYSGFTSANYPAGGPNNYIHVGSIAPSFNGVGSATFFGSAQLNNGQTMQGNTYLTSGNVQYALMMQSDGNLVLYSGTSALWASNTGGNPGAYLGVQSDGNIVIYSSSGQALWATNTGGQSTAYLVIQTDGNLVAYNTSGVAVWASNTGGHSTDTYYGADRAYNGATVNGGYYIRSSDLRYAVMMQSDGNLVLYGPGYHVLWANNENGNPGAYLGLQSDGNIVEYSSSGHALWATNTGGQSLNYLVMQSDGNLVAYNTSGSAIWATGTNGKI